MLANGLNVLYKFSGLFILYETVWNLNYYWYLIGTPLNLGPKWPTPCWFERRRHSIAFVNASLLAVCFYYLNMD